MSDYIDRNVAIDAFCGLADALNSAKAKQPNTLEAIEIRGKISGVYLCKGLIRTTKSADVAPVRHGRWEEYGKTWWCSECGFENGLRWDYCPCCGSKMDEEADA